MNTLNVFKAKYKLPISFLSICQFCKICEYFQSIVNMPASPIMAWGCSEAQKYLQSFRHKAASIEFFILHCYRFLLYFFLLLSFLYIAEMLMSLKRKDSLYFLGRHLIIIFLALKMGLLVFHFPSSCIQPICSRAIPEQISEAAVR